MGRKTKEMRQGSGLEGNSSLNCGRAAAGWSRGRSWRHLRALQRWLGQDIRAQRRRSLRITDSSQSSARSRKGREAHTHAKFAVMMAPSVTKSALEGRSALSSAPATPFVADCGDSLRVVSSS